MTGPDDGRLPTLEGPQVRLRQVEDDDAQALLRVFGDPEVVKYWSAPPLADLDAARALVSEIDDYRRAGTLYQWGVARQPDGELVGTCTLASIDRQHRRAEVGFAFRRDVWGTGIGAEAVRVLVAHAFGPLDMHRIEADVDPENVRALRLLERLGFRREGLARERWQSGHERRDGVMLGLLRSDARAWDNRSSTDGVGRERPKR